MSIDAAAISNTCFAVFGVAATYTPPGGAAVSITAVVDRDADLGGISSQFGVVERTTLISLLKAEVAVPVRGAVIVVGAESYSVERVMADDGYVVRVVVK